LVDLFFPGSFLFGVVETASMSLAQSAAGFRGIHPVFDRTEHRIAAISGWLIFAASIPYTLWALLWVVSGLAVLHIALNTTTSAEGRYGFLTWIGFWSAWPYVVFARYAWRKQPQHDDTVSLLTEASALADDLWARVSRTGQPGFPAGGASNALDDAVSYD
jgi:hypothetical protein